MHREFIQVGDRVLEAVLEEDEDGWWVVEVPELPGCVSQGRSYAEALENIREAAELYLSSQVRNFCPGWPAGYLRGVDLVRLILRSSPKGRRREFQAGTLAAAAGAAGSGLAFLAPALLLPLTIALYRALQERFRLPPHPRQPEGPKLMHDPLALPRALQRVIQEIPPHLPPIQVLDRTKDILRHEFGPFVEVIPPAELDFLSRHILLAAKAWQENIPKLFIFPDNPEREEAGVFYAAEPPAIGVNERYINDPFAVSVILAHELGHWAVWLTGRDLTHEEHEDLAYAIESYLLGRSTAEEAKKAEEILKEVGLDERFLRRLVVHMTRVFTGAAGD